MNVNRKRRIDARRALCVFLGVMLLISMAPATPSIADELPPVQGSDASNSEHGLPGGTGSRVEADQDAAVDQGFDMPDAAGADKAGGAAQAGGESAKQATEDDATTEAEGALEDDDSVALALAAARSLGTRGIEPRAGTPLRISTSDGQLNSDSFESVVRSKYSLDEIDATDTIVITGNVASGHQFGLAIGGPDGETPSGKFLRENGITKVDLSGYDGILVDAAFGHTSVTTVALGSNILWTPGMSDRIFIGCTSLTTISDTLVNADANRDVIDLSGVGAESIGTQWFSGATGITKVALGTSINGLDSRAFEDCTSLTGISDTAVNVSKDDDVVNFAGTGVSRLSDGVFAGCSGVTTVALGPSIKYLPESVFSECSIETLGTMLADVRANEGILDFGTDIGFVIGDFAFSSNETIETIVIPDVSITLGKGCFNDCTNLYTVTNSVANARGKSEGFIDFGTLRAIYASGGHQFNAEKRSSDTIAYLGTYAGPYVPKLLGDDPVFVPAANPSITLEAEPFTGTNVVYVKGPADEASNPPTTIVYPENLSPRSITYYQKVTATTDGNGTIKADKTAGDFLPDRIEARERLENVLADNANYAEANEALAYTIVADPGLRVEEITVNGTAVTPISQSGTSYQLEGVDVDANVHVTFGVIPTVTEHYVDRFGNAIAGLPDTTGTLDTFGNYAFAGSAPTATGYAYAGHQVTAPTPSSPSTVTDGNLPALTPASDAHVYLVYGADANADGKEDVQVIRHAIGTDGTALTTKHSPVALTVNLEDSPYEVDEAGVHESGWNYEGWNTDGSTTSPKAGKPSVALAPGIDVHVYHVYSPAPTDPIEPPGPTDPQDPIDPPGPTDPTDPQDPIDPPKPIDPADPGNYQFVKSPNTKTVNPGQTVTYTFSGFGNSWSIPLERFTISDMPEPGIDVKAAYLPSFSEGETVAYDVYYYTNLNGKRYIAQNLSAGSAQTITVPDMASGERVTGISFDFGTVPVGFAVGDTLTVEFKVWDNPPSRAINNTGMLSYKAGDEYKEFVSSGAGTSITLGGTFDLVRTGDGVPLGLIATLAGAILAAGGAAAFAGVRRKDRASK